MHKFLVTAAATLLALTATAVPPALAKGPGWKAAGAYPPGYGHGRKLGWGAAYEPPGFADGRKRGWRGRSIPPGWSHGRR